MLTQVQIAASDLEAKETAPFTALGFTTRATLRTLSEHAASVPTELHREITRLGLDIVGPMQWLYTGVNGDETNEFTLDIVVPVREALGQPNDGFSFREIPPFSCLAYTHAGPWSDFPNLYDALFAEIYRAGHRVTDTIREVYKRVDLENPAQCITEIQVELVAEPRVEAVVRRSLLLDAPVSRVWDALLRPELTRQYMYGCEAISNWQPGSPLLWKGTYEGQELVFVKGTVVEVEPERRLAYTMIDPNGGLEDLPENYLTATFALEPENGQTRLTIEQGDYTKVADGEKRYADTLSGWDAALDGLRRVVER